jgi:hypothetical protein
MAPSTPVVDLRLDKGWDRPASRVDRWSKGNKLFLFTKRFFTPKNSEKKSKTECKKVEKPCRKVEK